MSEMLLSQTEDEEDLEALRLAALQTLKPKQQQTPHFNGAAAGKFKRKFTPKNGGFNGWTRNANLISVPMVNEDKAAHVTESEPPQLILPQDRYCKSTANNNGKHCSDQSAATSKFDRYDNSDNSESDTEEEAPLKRSTSLEELMAELENEIKGKNNEENNVKKSAGNDNETENAVKENLEPEIAPPLPTSHPTQPSVPAQPPRKTPMRKKYHEQRRPKRTNNYHPPPPFNQPPPMVFAPPPLLPPPPPTTQYQPQYFDSYASRPPIYETLPPPPLPVLSINTDVYMATMAPLSPRSAAFVLKNRAIVEKRKRRSYSKSPTSSPKYRRRSNSPLSPVRRQHSLTPPRKTAEKSPKKPPIPLRERLGTKTTNTTIVEESRKDSGEEEEEILPKSGDPVLEARRRKFQTNEIRKKEGIIRLKAKTPEPQGDELQEEETREENEGELLLDEDELILDHTTLFSDEESNSDNEGRFKVKTGDETIGKKTTLPFTQLLNKAGGEKKKAATARRRLGRKRKSPGPPKKTKSVVKSDVKKIEIKIRNPSKYEKNAAEKSKTERKVQVARTSDCTVNTDEKPVKQNKDDANIKDGDLRAQLSRKRAERQKHPPLPDTVPTRLLQTALQQVGFRKKTVAAKNEDKNELAAVKEDRLPIHMRLGIEPLTKPSKKKGGGSKIAKRSGTKAEQV